MDKLKEILSIGLIIFSLFLILFLMEILNNNEFKYDNYDKKKNFEILSDEKIIELAKTNLDVIRSLARDNQIIDGPRIVNNDDRKKISSIYPDVEPLYQIVIRKNDYDLYVIMNQTSVIHTIPLSYFR